jgi:hypothetical protein
MNEWFEVPEIPGLNEVKRCRACGYTTDTPLPDPRRLTRRPPIPRPFGMEFFVSPNGNRPMMRRTCPRCGYQWAEWTLMEKESETDDPPKTGP